MPPLIPSASFERTSRGTTRVCVVVGFFKICNIKLERVTWGCERSLRTISLLSSLLVSLLGKGGLIACSCHLRAQV